MAAASAQALSVSLIALPGFPLVAPGDDLPALVLDALATAKLSLEPGDILVAAQKIFSKAENRFVALSTVTPTAEAEAMAAEVDKDPRLVALILAEARAVIRHRPGVLIVEHRLGFVMANAGIDQSNVGPGSDRVLLLPEAPDASCRRLAESLAERAGVTVPVVMNDSHGRAWRQGTVGVAIGSSGLAPVQDLTGRPDLFDRPMRVTEVGVADELAAAASLVMGQGDEGRPVVLVRGFDPPPAGARAKPLLRPKAEDLFR